MKRVYIYRLNRKDFFVRWPHKHILPVSQLNTHYLPYQIMPLLKPNIQRGSALTLRPQYVAFFLMAIEFKDRYFDIRDSSPIQIYIFPKPIMKLPIARKWSFTSMHHGRTRIVSHPAFSPLVTGSYFSSTFSWQCLAKDDMNRFR